MPVTRLCIPKLKKVKLGKQIVGSRAQLLLFPLNLTDGIPIPEITPKKKCKSQSSYSFRNFCFCIPSLLSSQVLAQVSEIPEVCSEVSGLRRWVYLPPDFWYTS